MLCLLVYVAFDCPVPIGNTYQPEKGVKCRFEGQQVVALKQLLSPGFSIALSGAWNLVDGSEYELIVSHVDLDITDKNYSQNVQELLS